MREIATFNVASAARLWPTACWKRPFFLATADANGQPDCSFKGGVPGFVRVPAPDLLIFPDYDGNGMFKSLGNIRDHPNVGLLFIAMSDKPKRMRVNGTAQLCFDDPLLTDSPGGQLIVRVTPAHIFPNCPRYIPQLQLVAPSAYVPAAGCAPVEPAWKGFADFSDVVPPRKHGLRRPRRMHKRTAAHGWQAWRAG